MLNNQTFTSPFTGNIIEPTDVSYYNLASFTTNQTLFWPAVVNPTQVPATRIMDISAAAAGLSIALPEGGQGSVGSDILFNNKGSFDVIITDYQGNASVTVPSGKSYYFFLTDNSTIAGTWENIAFGSTTSFADASSLAGPGLTTYSGKLAVAAQVITVSTPPALSSSTIANTYIWNTGNGAITLPASGSLQKGWWIGFRNNGSGSLVFQTQGTDTLNTGTSITTAPGDSGYIVFQQTTGKFYTIGWSQPPVVTFTSGTYDVDSIVGNTMDLTSFAPIIQTYLALSGTRTQSLAVTLPNVTQMYILFNDTGHSGYDITFQAQGSSQPPLVVKNGTIATILCDQDNIYLLFSGSYTVFQAQPGTAAAPGYSFTTDSTSGMWLPGVGILGLTAGGTNMLTLDNSNPNAPAIVTQATFTATGGIFSGTF